MDTTLNDIFSILRIPPQFRSHSHVEALMRQTQNVQFFMKLATEHNFSEIHKDCCKVMTLEEYSEDDFIFKAGEPGDKFYIILAGSVAVKFPVHKTVVISRTIAKKLEKYFCSVSEHNSDSEAAEKQSPKFHRMTTINIPDTVRKLKLPYDVLNEFLGEDRAVLNYFKSMELHRVQEILEKILAGESEHFEVDIEDLNEIGILFAGSSFGELALISDKTRSASIQARERSSFLVLSKTDFKAILGTVSEKKLLNVIKFLQKVQYFHSWSKNALTKIAYYLETAKYKNGQNIYREGEYPDKIFFIKDGEVTIEKRKPTKKIENFPIFSSSPKDFAPKSFRKIKIVNDVKIVIKSRFEAFGGYELVDHIDKRTCSCVCTSASCELLYMSRTSFLNRVPNFEHIKNLILEENQRIVKRFAEINEKDEQDFRSFTPGLIERSEIFQSQTPKFIRVSSNSKKNLQKIVKSPKGTFLRKLTRQEIEDAVNGRASAMRMYGSKTNIVNSSFGNFLKRKLLPIDPSSLKIFPE